MSRRISRSNPLAALVVSAVAAVVAAVTFKEVQVAITLSLLVLLFGIRLHSRRAAIVMLWLLWLFVPMLRRCLELAFAAPAADPLVLLPIAATFLLALMEFRQNRLDHRARTVLGCAGAAFLIGAPIGFTVDPAAAIFAGLAYVSGLSALIIGWGEEVDSGYSGPTSLERMLTYGLVPIALYGIAQFFFPFTPWDHHWIESVKESSLDSIESPQKGHIRIFGTLNSPFTFAMVLAIGLMFAVTLRKRASVKALVLVPLVVALALTFVRSAWLALIVGIIVYAAAGSDRSAGKTVSYVVFALFAVVIIGGSNPTTKAFTERFTSLGDPGSDYSANDRFSTSVRLIPESIGEPMGKGLGQAGLAANLNESKKSGVVNIDDGYLAVLYQSGPLAFILLLIAFFAVVRASIQALANAPPTQRPYRAIVMSILVMMLVAQASGDVLFGVTGVIFWYLGGLSLAAAKVEAKEPVPINAPSPVGVAPA